MKKFSAYILILTAFSFINGCVPSVSKTTSMTPLITAAARGDINAVKDLLAKGSNACEKDEAGGTPYMGSVENGYTCRNEIFRILIENAYETFNKGGRCPRLLYYAAGGGCNDITKRLLEKGYDPNDPNERFKTLTALSYAVYNGQMETAKLLINKGADLDLAIYGLKEHASRQLPHLGNPSNDKAYDNAKLSIETLNRLKPKQVEPKTNVASGLTKEDLTTIVQAAVEGAKTQKQESKSPSMQSDIDKPAFAQSERIMGENDLAVIIGIEGYQSLPKSDYSYDDARLMGDYAKAMGFKPRNIEMLLEERATKSAIEKIIKTWLPNKAKPDSRVFIYYSGHGAPEPKTGDAYIVPFDGDPNYLSDTGYPLKSLYDSLGKLQVAEVTVVLDACFSGAGGRSVLAKGARPLVMMTTSTVLSSNMAVLSATQGTQISTSSPEKGHGVFTYYFLKALKDGKKTIAEIYEYIKPLVEDEAKQINVQQSPSVSPDAEKLKGRFILRR
ncbi:MAG: caspase family protein [Nitrospirae bacterium]|nr:caspase family protein [Nitrospirota bacterium]